MFAITKQQKIKSMLKKHLKADFDLLTEATALDPDGELYHLQINDITLRRKKIAILFDALKYQLEEFTSPNASDTWVYDKPLYSEGAVFSPRSHSAEDFTVDPYLDTPTLSRPNPKKLIASDHRLRTESLMQYHLRTRVEMLAEEELVAKAKTIFQPDTMTNIQLLNAYIMYQEINNRHLVLCQSNLESITNLEEVARASGSNIIITP